MPDKKHQILQAALQLFAEHGYDATSTSKIAKLAGVSEGLIFRHYTNKQGLLDALLEQMKEKLSHMVGPIFLEQDPRKIIHMTIEIFSSIPKEEYPYWRLQHMLKWNPTYNDPHKLAPFMAHISQAFAQLGLPEPEMEANMLWCCMEGAGTAILRDQTLDSHQFMQFLKKKYTF